MVVHSAVESMLRKHPHKTKEDQTNALKEIIQQIALLGLFRGGFFDQAAFYGGTAMRLFHGLPRFSEDLGFSLIKKNKNFSLASYCEAVRTELLAYGFEAEVEHKEKAVYTVL
jgi:predicted nucleotidyltransferase component of viral defense system